MVAQSSTTQYRRQEVDHRRGPSPRRSDQYPHRLLDPVPLTAQDRHPGRLSPRLRAHDRAPAHLAHHVVSTKEIPSYLPLHRTSGDGTKRTHGSILTMRLGWKPRSGGQRRDSTGRGGGIQPSSLLRPSKPNGSSFCHHHLLPLSHSGWKSRIRRHLLRCRSKALPRIRPKRNGLLCSNAWQKQKLRRRQQQHQQQQQQQRPASSNLSHRASFPQHSRIPYLFRIYHHRPQSKAAARRSSALELP